MPSTDANANLLQLADHRIASIDLFFTTTQFTYDYLVTISIRPDLASTIF